MSPFPPPPPGAERRIHPRTDVLAQVELLRGDEVVIAAVSNLSLGGAFLLHDGDAVAIGHEVLVHLSSDTVHVQQRARIVRVTPTGFAVAWIEPRARTYAVIERLWMKPARQKAEKRSKSAVNQPP